MGKPLIDIEIYAKGIVDGLSKAEAYRLAGYKPEGDKDHASACAQQFEKRTEVQAKIAELREIRFSRVKHMMTKELENFMDYDFKNLKGMQKWGVLRDLAEMTGQKAPQQVQVDDKRQIRTISSVSDKLLDKLLENEDVRQAALAIAGSNARTIEGTASGRPRTDERLSGTGTEYDGKPDERLPAVSEADGLSREGESEPLPDVSSGKQDG